MIVVLDTNICIPRTHLLGNESGQQLLKLLEAHQGELFLPQILRREYLERTKASTHDYQEGMTGKARNIRTLLGQEVRFDKLPDEVIEQAVHERLKSLKHITREGPTEDDLHAVTSRRVIAKRPPVTEKKHGHKDCMIWEALLTLPAGSEVWLISNDGGFFEGERLHPVLIEEARSLHLTVHAHRTLEPLLEVLRHKTSEIDLASADVAEKAQNAPEVETIALIPPAPAALPTEAVTEAPSREVDDVLTHIQAAFQQIDTRVLGFIAFLDAPSKDELLTFCEGAGLDRDIAQTSADRLAQGGAVTDTGTHFLVADKALAQAARTRIQGEIIQLIVRGQA